MSWKRKKIIDVFQTIKLSGEQFVLGPEIASYRGATARYGRVKCDGLIGLTQEKVIFVPFVGRQKDIPIQEINNVSEQNTFLGQVRVGLHVLVLHGKDADIGFYVKDINRWQNTIAALLQ